MRVITKANVDPAIRPAVRQKIMIFPANGASCGETIVGPSIIEQEETYPFEVPNAIMNNIGQKSL